jgi:hypothetical protein
MNAVAPLVIARGDPFSHEHVEHARRRGRVGTVAGATSLMRRPPGRRARLAGVIVLSMQKMAVGDCKAALDSKGFSEHTARKCTKSTMTLHCTIPVLVHH